MDQQEDIRIIRVALPGGRVACIAISVWPEAQPADVSMPTDAELSLAGDAIKKLQFKEI